MNQGFLANLPSETIIDILSRLPVRTIISCEGVCKLWYNLLNTQEFVKSHLSKSAPGLVFFQSREGRDLFTLFEFEDELEAEHHELHYKPITKFDLKEFIIPHFGAGIKGSANGLLFLSNVLSPLCICNPIRREYIKIPSPEWIEEPYNITYGFGTSIVTGKHKVVRITHDYIRFPETDNSPKSDCQVYTLETGSWRYTSPGPTVEYYDLQGAFLNGNLHWLVGDFLKGSFLISCFDLETELFTTFPAPCPPQEKKESLDDLMDMRGLLDVGMVALGGCLCLCDSTSGFAFVIWIMKEYGVDKSWSKAFVIRKIYHDVYNIDPVYPIKVFKDGDILMRNSYTDMFYYCNKTKTTQGAYMFQQSARRTGRLDAMLHTPTFVSLRGIAKENVYSF